MKIVDVTELVDFENNDDEHLPITMCVCGKRFDAWDFIITVGKDWTTACPECGAKLYFGNAIRVYEVVDEEE